MTEGHKQLGDRATAGEVLELSIVVPAYNEEESIVPLFDAIRAAVDPLTLSYEVVFIDDGSTDGTVKEIEGLELTEQIVKCIRLRRNFGKSLALAAGVAECNGESVVTMDADLQDDPGEIPALIAKIEEGWDLVSGWKARRKDPLEKRFASKLFNSIVSKISGVKLNDFNCGLKAYRSEVVKKINVYGGRHRFIPVIAHSFGFRICELVVKHHERKHGTSKYGLKRYFSGFLDFFAIVFLMFFQRRPLHFLGWIAAIPFFIGLALVVYVMIMKFAFGETGNRPSLIAGVFFMGLSFQIFIFGLLAELITHLRISESFNPHDFVAGKSRRGKKKPEESLAHPLEGPAGQGVRPRGRG
jgi:glycosyltransferase involved in cell wall biosynthesis